MPYFKYFPDIRYKVDPDLGSVILKDINLSYKFSDLFGNNYDQLYDDYQVKDGEKPEHLAYKLYGDSELHWVLLAFNQIKNPYFDWVMADQEFQDYLVKKYGGVTLFINPGSKFYKSNNVNETAESRIEFVVGSEVTQGSTKATITEWNPSIRALRVGNITGGEFVVSGDRIKVNYNNSSFYVTVGRVVLDSTLALHHFEDTNGVVLDPYNLSGGLQEDSYLIRYINNSYDGVEVITNREHEDRENEKKRFIKILKKQYVPSVVSALNAIMKS